ncbi:putative transposase [Bradyrhizobium sp. USDA 3240]
MKFAFVAKHRTIWPVAWLCDALGVSRSGFHAWLNRSPSTRSRSDEELGGKVKASFAASDRTYDARRVWRDLLADGADCGLHRIERLMRLQGLRARPRRRRLPKDSGDRQLETVPANLLDRQFAAERPNQKWIADFTYLWTAEGWLYVAAVIDLFSRRVVGWSMSAAMTAQLVTDALLMAVWRRGKPDALLHHSDQGSQYTSEQFQRLMADHGIVCSMSWRASSPRSRPSVRPTRFIEPEMRHAPMCSTTSNDFTTRPAGTRPSAISARLSSSARWD